MVSPPDRILPVETWEPAAPPQGRLNINTPQYSGGFWGAVIPGRCEASNLRGAIAPRGSSRFRVWSFGPSRNDGDLDSRCAMPKEPFDDRSGGIALPLR